VVGELGVAAIEQRIVQVRMQNAAFEVIEDGRGQRSSNSWTSVASVPQPPALP
jgi:hypothetical protein